jgi:hypothetical protein
MITIVIIVVTIVIFIMILPCSSFLNLQNVHVRNQRAKVSIPCSFIVASIFYFHFRIQFRTKKSNCPTTSMFSTQITFHIQQAAMPSLGGSKTKGPLNRPERSLILYLFLLIGGVLYVPDPQLSDLCLSSLTTTIPQPSLALFGYCLVCSLTSLLEH